MRPHSGLWRGLPASNSQRRTSASFIWVVCGILPTTPQITLDLLSNRQVRMIFVVDRDESDDHAVKIMIERLGERASLVVLERRELENYLLEANAILGLLRSKGIAETALPSIALLGQWIRQGADELRGDVVRLRLERQVLRAVHLIRRGMTGEPAERLAQAIGELKARLEGIEAVRDGIRTQVDLEWETNWIRIAPGSLVLDKVLGQCGARYNKAAGDTARLASLIDEPRIHLEIRTILNRLVG